jgi:AcrR family transcriptional regulator
MPRRLKLPLDAPLPASQQRSRQTLDRLLAAAEDALREDGPDGATLRSIAQRAGVSIGIVYRRFPDKDTILRAVYIRFFERVAALNATNLSSPNLAQLSLRTVIRRLVEGIAAGYRANRSLLRALILYARTHDDADFKRRAAALNAAALDGIVALLEARASEIDHPNPADAIRFGVRAVASTLQEYLIFETPGTDHVDRDTVVSETTRLFLRYLGVG